MLSVNNFFRNFAIIWLSKSAPIADPKAGDPEDLSHRQMQGRRNGAGQQPCHSSKTAKPNRRKPARLQHKTQRMKHLKPLLLAAGGLLSLTACHDDNPWNMGKGQGRIVPKVSADPGVTDVVGTRDGEGYPVPETNQLKLTLNKVDGSFSSSWESVDLFPTDKAFTIGAYTLEASYGTEGEEGFERPYFYGSTNFNVLEEETANPSVTATLANCMVSVDYTEDFIHYFKSYSTQLHSAGGDFITFIPDESRPAFLNPGQCTVTVNIVKQNGVSATLEAAKIDTQARHHYHLTLDVNGGQTGDAQLVVNFDDSLTTEDVVIDLTDDLLLSPEPKVVAHGFTPDRPLTVIEGSEPDEPTYFVVNAQGGLASATLTTESPELIRLGMPAEIDLMAATEAQKALLQQLGLEVNGLFTKPDKMAKVDFSKLVANIKGAGTHKFSLVVKDKLSKVNLPVTCTVQTEAVVLDLLSTTGIFLGDTEATVKVDYNGSNPQKNITVESLDAYGVWKACAIKSITATTRASEAYNIKFEIPDTEDDVKIRLKYKGTVTDSGILVRSGVALTTTPGDTWATKTICGITKKADIAYSSLKFYVSKDGGSWATAQATVDESTGKVTFTGLTPGSNYKVKATETGQYEENYPSLSFTTETAAQPQDANMDNWGHDTGWKRGSSVAGGQTIYQYFVGSANNSYWATRNALTANDFGYNSTYYNAYSGTYGVANGSGQAAEICSEGYAKTAANTFTRLGGNCNKVDAGMLFMGTYSYDENSDKETFSYGRPFTSRPTSLQFDYKYEPCSGEQFEVVVVIENRNGGKTTELARYVYHSGDAKSAFTTLTIPLTYTNTSLKATHAYVIFMSSTASSPAKNDVVGSMGAFQGYKDARYIGSKLTVDNITFKY